MLSGILSRSSQNHRPKGNLSQSLHMGTLGVRCPSIGRLWSQCFKFLRTHCSPTLGRIRRRHRTVAQTLISVFRAISNEMSNLHSQKEKERRGESQSYQIQRVFIGSSARRQFVATNCACPLTAMLWGRAVITSFSSAGMP